MPETTLLSAFHILILIFSKFNTTYRYYYTRFVHTRYYVGESKCTPIAQLSPAIYSSAAQRSAVRCRAVLGCAFFRTAVLGMKRSTRYQVPVCTCCVLVFLPFLQLISLGPHVSAARKLHPYFRSERDTATSAQHSIEQLALHKQLLELSIRCSHQIMGLFLLLPLHVLAEPLYSIDYTTITHWYLTRYMGTRHFATRAAFAARYARSGMKTTTNGVRRTEVHSY